jgi:hypothetical protein
MPSADFCAAFGGSPPSRQSDHKGHGRQRRRPPEVSLTAFRTAPPEFTWGALDGYGLRGPTPARPAPVASNPVLVHWLVHLLHASFRPNLAVGHALAFRYPSPPSGWQGTFTPKLSNMLSTRDRAPLPRAQRGIKYPSRQMRAVGFAFIFIRLGAAITAASPPRTGSCH